jgi:hypothetical protein
MIPNRLLFEMDVLRPKWGWLLALGILMATLGTIALLIVPAATIGTALVVGWLLIFSGIIEMVHAFSVRRWGGLFLHLIGGILGLLIGLLVVTHPVAGGARMDAPVRIFSYYHGSLSVDSVDQPQVSSLGLGSLRWDRHARPWDSAVGRLAVVRSVVPGPVSRNFTGAAWLVIRDVCDRHSKLAGACRCTPGSVVRNLVFYKEPGKFLLMCDDIRISPSPSTLERVLSMMHLPKLPGGRADAAD